ncbi:MAG: F0F1 ATP synthase subunit epsilon [Stappia sp.]|uniref:F0F1 ATP synthase subunit epsilon n=1 Tax=Stappia sp. TaxID=1870903 RepID=UPI000C4A278D|nr:F0F1 ATP synthase subunit epsilon [Stappia sp.]MAA98056.1 F0F1 ATP synthase subunit epsilon [Stappia sp.]MBM19363.1 F0F1 ATP synthase subunit epsilon [Stappia sp.]
MAAAFKFELVSPERLLVSEEVQVVVVPGSEGEFGVMAGHAPFVSTLRPGFLKVSRTSGEELDFFVRGGFAEVNAGGLTVLAERAIARSDLKADEIAQQITDAEEDVADAKDEATRDRAAETLQQLRDVQSALQSL